jgi:hypothetical protein
VSPLVKPLVRPFVSPLLRPLTIPPAGPMARLLVDFLSLRLPAEWSLGVFAGSEP